jgi:alkanesulfonate monooxygenase SsuD/methylene tetrahydromethanopterin reductase-like flavin-dependent oxidoreductase (luciferase family)
MQVFVFDHVSYPVRLENLVEGGGDQLPYPLPKRHFQPDAAVSNYREHLEAWALMDELGFDGVSFNEHHASPYGLMNSPNLMAAAASQCTNRMKLLIYGNVLPIQDPLRLAEEISMVDCLTKGRLIAGIVRGIPREYLVYNVDMGESRARFEESFEVMKHAWEDEVFSYEGQFWSYNDVSIWPRPVQQPRPPVWMPVSVSKSSIEWAGRENIPITPGEGSVRSVTEDIIRHYAESLDRNGYSITPDHLIMRVHCYVADSRQQALEEAGPYALYYWRTLFGHGSDLSFSEAQRQGYSGEADLGHLRPESLQAHMAAREVRRRITLEDMQDSDRWCAGSPEEVRDRLISQAEAVGANTIMLNFNQGAMPHEMNMRVIRRFAEEVLPDLQAHQVTTVPAAR